jgi:C1A family cysteine protease
MGDDTSMIGHGRLHAPDERDHKYLMPRKREAAGVDTRYWHTPPAYDQGSTPMCVAYAGVRYLTTGPIVNKPIAFAELYHECQTLDEWPGESYDGTSVRACFKALQRRGMIESYLWGFEVAPVIEHLLVAGPVVMGTVWSDAMANLPYSCELTVDEDLSNVGEGHAWCLIGASRSRVNADGSTGAARGVNSWGKKWGTQQGRFWVSFNNLDRLIKADGEAAIATEIKVK